MSRRPLGKDKHSSKLRSYRSLEDLSDSPSKLKTSHGIGHDLHSDAKIWAMYVEEATEHDKAMLKDWSDTLDVLLILSGLFSAVLTAFLLESKKLLEPDPQNNMVALLAHVVEGLDRALHANNTVLPPITEGPPSFSQTFKAPAYALWLCAMWFSSLVCSLSAAFIAMLVKQWLQAYSLERPGRMEALARQRHFRYVGLLKWKVSEIIAILPGLLQIGFGLFFGGLDILLWSSNRPIAYLMMFLTGLLFCFYLVTTIAPLFDPACPFKTPFSLVLRSQIRRAHCLGGVSLEYLGAFFAAIKDRVQTGIPSLQPLLDTIPPSNLEMEQLEIDRSYHAMNLGVIEWLIVTSRKREIVDISLKAIASLRPHFNATPRLRDSGAIQLLVNCLDPPQISNRGPMAAAFRDHAADSIAYLASMFCSLRHCTAKDIAHIANHFHWRAWIVSWGDFTLEQLVSDGWNLDALALYLCASTQCDRAQGRRANREFRVMLELLNRHARGDAEMSGFSVWALVDSIALWGAEFEETSMVSTRPSVVACLLRLLALPYAIGDPVTCAIGVALGVFALNFRGADITNYRAEEERQQDTHFLLVRGVVDILKEASCPQSRYALNKEDFETGGFVICRLLIENNVPSASAGVSTALVCVLDSSISEELTCRVLETFRRLLSFDAQSTVPNLSSAIIPLLEDPTARSVQVKATQVLGELMHWREHREATLAQGGVQSLIRNLTSASEDLSNASSLALIDLARHTHAREVMVNLGLAKALTTFFGSSNVSQQNLVYWSWTFVGPSWTDVWYRGAAADDFKAAFHELAQVLEASMRYGGSDKDVALTPARRRDLQRILRRLKDISGRYTNSDEEEVGGSHT